MTVVLHTTHCPKCSVLEAKLKAKNIEYEMNEDVELMLSKGIEVVPYLEVDGEMLDFKAAVDWVNNKEDV